jgi:hypothetical protein
MGRPGGFRVDRSRPPSRSGRTGTVAKHNTPAGFVLSQDTDGVTIGEDQIGKIQHKDTVGRRCVAYLAQLAHIVNVKLTADLEHNRSGPRAMNFQHRPSCYCNCQAS